MAEELTGNCLVAQSGGPTTVINASLAGVITEALNHEPIEEIYGGLNGVLGILNEDIIDLAEESQQTIRALRHTAASALGTCRFKLKHDTEYNRILEVFEAHNIRYFFYIGGNDSQDTANKISKLARSKGYDLNVIGIPKTIDNDLVGTDHCPGYGSVIKFIGTTVRELAADNECMGQGDLVSVLEVMGRNAGWIAAGASLAKRKDKPNDAPHLIYLPEVPFTPEKFIADVQRVLATERYCLIIVGEGLVDSNGNYISTTTAQTDAFGHVQLGGSADYMCQLVEQNLTKVKARSAKLGITQRAAVHCSSKIDNDEAFLVGQAAVQQAVNGVTDKMVTLVRKSSSPYQCSTGLCDLEEVANGVKRIPEHWLGEDGVSLNYHFMQYAYPLIQGEVEVPFGGGLPKRAYLKKIRKQKLLPKFLLEG